MSSAIAMLALAGCLNVVSAMAQPTAESIRAAASCLPEAQVQSAQSLAAAWSTAGWPTLAGLGLAAVVAGAASVRRPRHRGHTLSLPADALPKPSIAPDPLPGLPVDPLRVGDVSEPLLGPAGHDARAYLALHHVDLAIDTLRRHVDGGGRPMPVAWLMLLDLYRTHGREAAFNELAVRFHREFNAQAPQWDQFPPDDRAPGLEAFPRLIREISQCWGTHECRRVLDRLLYDNRSGRRMGFTLNAYNDLLALRELSDELLETIEADLAEEAKVHAAFAAAEVGLSERPAGASRVRHEADLVAMPGEMRSGPLAMELEAQLDADLRVGADARAALEVEHPALAGMLAREWGNSPLAARLCAVLARGADPGHALSPEAAADLAMLGQVARDLAGSDAREV